MARKVLIVLAVILGLAGFAGLTALAVVTGTPPAGWERVQCIRVADDGCSNWNPGSDGAITYGATGNPSSFLRATAPTTAQAVEDCLEDSDHSDGAVLDCTVNEEAYASWVEARHLPTVACATDTEVVVQNAVLLNRFAFSGAEGTPELLHDHGFTVVGKEYRSGDGGAVCATVVR